MSRRVPPRGAPYGLRHQDFRTFSCVDVEGQDKRVGRGVVRPRDGQCRGIGSGIGDGRRGRGECLLAPLLVPLVWTRQRQWPVFRGLVVVDEGPVPGQDLLL